MSFIDLRHRVSVVTGAARGIGAAIAAELAAAGSHIALLDIEDQAVKETAAKIARDAGIPVRAYRVDMRDPAAVDTAIKAVAADFGGIDHLVNNAGVQYISSIAEFPIDKWDLVTQIDLDGVFYATKAAWPFLVERKRGRIVNIASVQGLIASEFKPAYVAAKHGVVGLTRAAALEGAPAGITANAICPGAVMTDLIRNQAADLARSYGGGISEEEALARAFLSAMPTKRFIEPVEVAQLCVYLCTESARSITGAAISIDGGWSAH
ncbi:MAG TPA: 3-hydroxybutyrate dehydrogenase [Candidatus Binatia bacterium]|nr:3-hydroxybutyrate dehydrogenase [Candidatus Binatia bacterium]